MNPHTVGPPTFWVVYIFTQLSLSQPISNELLVHWIYLINSLIVRPGSCVYTAMMIVTVTKHYEKRDYVVGQTFWISFFLEGAIQW
jgi:hypothetical protein